MKLTKHSEGKYTYHGKESTEPLFGGKLALGFTLLVGIGLLWMFIVGLGF
jgi:hypothetical protein